MRTCQRWWPAKAGMTSAARSGARRARDTKACASRCHAVGGRCARLRREPVGHDDVVLALVAERVERVEEDARILVGERVEDQAAALLGDAPAHPSLQRLEPHHRRAIGERGLQELDAASGFNRRARTRQRQHGQPANLRLLVFQSRRQGRSVHRLRGDQRCHGVAAQLRRARAFPRDRQRAEAVERDVLKRQQLAVAPCERLQAAERTDCGIGRT